MQTLPATGLAETTQVIAPEVVSSGAPPRDPPKWTIRLNAAITALIVIGTTVFVFVQLRPDLLFNPNMDVGGDNAAHVAAVYYFIHHLIPQVELSGWDPQWFGGFPLYVFYFPLPAVFIAVLTPIFSYAVAFKLITVLGALLMPLAAYLFGRLAGLARPIPALMCAAMLPFLFNTSYTIDGGNIASTLAGEYSFSLATAFGLVFLGVLSYGLTHGRLRWLAALLFAVTLLCHVVPALFFGGAAVALTLTQQPTRFGLRVLAPIGIAGALTASFWLLPFAADLRYSSSMGYDRVGGLFGQLVPHGGESAVQWLALGGAMLALAQRNRIMMALTICALGAAAAFTALPSGLVYNARWLPFWFLTTALLAAYAVAEAGRFICRMIGHARAHEWATGLVGAGASLCIVAAYLGVLPGYTTPAGARSFVPDWVSWNYTGYQGKSGWPEFQRIITMMDDAAAVHGCGRLDYEYSPNVNNFFGSTIVEMSFPMWTNGCIDSEEGVYYESSTSTPFHFLDQAQLSIQASNPVVGIPYQSLDVADGVRHLQLTGTQYFLANSPTVEAQAAVDPLLTEVGSTPANPTEIDSYSSSHPALKSARWILYTISGSALVTPLAYQPVVEAGMSKSAWRAMAISWYQNEASWAVPVAPSGPASWQRVTSGSLPHVSGAKRLSPVSISHITSTDQTVSFQVSRTGVPVLVKVPYFPNWRASGAQGPYEVTPNSMVVIPRSHHVELSYGTTTIDWLGRLGTGFGLIGLITLRAPIEPPPLPEAPAPPPAPEPGAPLLLPASNDEGDADDPPEDPNQGRFAFDGPTPGAPPANLEADATSPHDDPAASTPGENGSVT